MAVNKKAKAKRNRKLGWRGPLVFLLAFLGILSLTAFSMVHWTERQVLTTDNWVKLVAPLPKNDKVATALSQYSVDQLFTNINLEQKVSDALPDKASFLAGPLVDQLQTRTENLTKKVIQSDQFQTVWVTANRAAHSRLMAQARGETPPAPKRKVSFNLDLQSLRTNIRNRLGITSAPLFSNAGGGDKSDVGLGVNLKTKLDRFSQFVKAVDFLNATLWLAALAALLGALAITWHRRRLLMIISLAIIIVGLLQLIGVKAVRPAVLDHVQNSAYRPAVAVIYDNLLANFRHSATVLAVVGAVILALAYLTQDNFLNKSKFVSAQIKSVKQTGLWKWKMQARKSIWQYRWWLSLAAILLGLVLGAAALNLDARGLVQLSLSMLVAIELIYLAGNRPLPAPNKNPRAK